MSLSSKVLATQVLPLEMNMRHQETEHDLIHTNVIKIGPEGDPNQLSGHGSTQSNHYGWTDGRTDNH